jgi:hypothetical protein
MAGIVGKISAFLFSAALRHSSAFRARPSRSIGRGDRTSRVSDRENPVYGFVHQIELAATRHVSKHWTLKTEYLSVLEMPKVKDVTLILPALKTSNHNTERSQRSQRRFLHKETKATKRTIPEGLLKR